MVRAFTALALIVGLLISSQSWSKCGLLCCELDTKETSHSCCAEPEPPEPVENSTCFCCVDTDLSEFAAPNLRLCRIATQATPHCLSPASFYNPPTQTLVALAKPLKGSQPVHVGCSERLAHLQKLLI